MSEFRQQVLQGLNADHPIDALYDAVRAEQRRGTGNDELLSELVSLSPSLTEDEYDAAVAVMDGLTGWCSPGARLDIPLRVSSPAPYPFRDTHAHQ